MNSEEKQHEIQRRIAACVNAFEGIPTDRIEGKNLGEILAGEMRLHGAGPRGDGGFGFEFSGGVCQLLAEAYAEQFKQSGAINYLELLFQHSDIGPLTITMQRVEGLTPAQKLAQAEAERDALQAKLAELEKQERKPSYFLSRIESSDRWGPEVELRIYESQLDACKSKDDHGGGIIELFTRPAPAVSLADLVPDEMPDSAYEIMSDKFGSGACMISDDMWNACRAAILRNIEEAK